MLEARPEQLRVLISSYVARPSLPSKTPSRLRLRSLKIPLAPTNISYGRILDSGTQAPIYQANVGITGSGVNDSFLTGPLGFYFFSGLTDGTYQLSANATAHQLGMASTMVASGTSSTQAVRTDLNLVGGCTCSSGKVCGPTGTCLDPCVLEGEFETCNDPTATCANGACVVNGCDTLTCAMGWSCDNGKCVEDICQNVCCSTGQICLAGQCVTNNCGTGCLDGLTCIGGKCADPCFLVTCVDGLVCQAGNCVEKCKASPSSCMSTPDGGADDTPDLGVSNGLKSDGANGRGVKVGCTMSQSASASGIAGPLFLLALVAWRARRKRSATA